MKSTRYARVSFLSSCCAMLLTGLCAAQAEPTPGSQQGLASWYGEHERGRLMANGHKFNPDRMTAASWFYPLGTRVRVTVSSPNFETRSVLVTVTDRGPARRLVQQGRVIDLGQAAFKKIAPPDLGLVEVVVERAP